VLVLHVSDFNLNQSQFCGSGEVAVEGTMLVNKY
jgi:hypothetical protein